MFPAAAAASTLPQCIDPFVLASFRWCQLCNVCCHGKSQPASVPGSSGLLSLMNILRYALMGATYMASELLNAWMPEYC